MGFDKIKKVAGALIAVAMIGTAVAKNVSGDYSSDSSNIEAQKAQADKQKNVVASCKSLVQASYSEGNFDAYITSDGSISYVGTADEQFSFEKCLNGRGVNLSH